VCDKILELFETCFVIINIMKPAGAMKRYSLKPKGKNIEVALQLLELSLILKKSVKKAAKKRRIKRPIRARC